MPNGGSDCCGTCWFNTKNDETGRPISEKKEEIAKCLIRNLEIPKPFWTYCRNHPYHNPKKINLPLGCVYICVDYPYYRKIWMAPPDTEEIRKKLLEILDEFNTSIQAKDYSEYTIENEVIHQLRILKENRAIPKLLRITKLDISDYRKTRHITSEVIDKAITVGLAIEALLEMGGDAYLNHVEHFINLGIEKPDDGYDIEKDGVAAVRYHFIRGLEFCDDPKADELLRRGLEDPNYIISAFAQEILKKRTRH